MTQKTVEVTLDMIQDYVNILGRQRFSDNDEGDYWDRIRCRKINTLTAITFQNKKARVPVSILQEYMETLQNQRFSDNDEGDYYYNQRNQKVKQVWSLICSA